MLISYKVVFPRSLVRVHLRFIFVLFNTRLMNGGYIELVFMGLQAMKITGGAPPWMMVSRFLMWFARDGFMEKMVKKPRKG